MDTPRILIVDDSPTERALLRSLLAHQDWTLDEAGSGSDALAAAARTPYDAILLDYLMPDLDGIEVLKRLRKAGITTPVVVVTASDEDLAKTLIREGASDFLPKAAISALRLTKTLEDAVRLSVLERQIRAAARNWVGPAADAIGAEHLRILVVDDSPVTRTVVMQALKMAKWKADEAGTGRDAVTVGTSRAHDCILLDHLLPDMTGLDTLEVLRASGCRTPVIALTGSEDDGVAARYLGVGASEFLTKSEYTPVRIVATVRSVVRRDRLEDVARGLAAGAPPRG